MLGRQLRILRDRARMTRDEAAQCLGRDPSKISRIEHGDIREDELSALLDRYGVAEESQRLAFLQLVQRVNERPWWHEHKQALPGWLCSYMAFESAADQIRTYEVRFIPGLLQTRAYAESVIRQDSTSEADIQRRIEVRMRRQQRVFQRRKPRLWAVIDEAALTHHITGADVMRGQIDALISAIQNDHASIQILRKHNSAIAAAANSFSILRLGIKDLQDVIYLEHFSNAQFLDDPAESDVYAHLWAKLNQAADHPQKAIALLRQLRDETVDHQRHRPR